MADEQFYTILTNIGKAKIANAGMLGKSVVLDKIQAGDGGGNYYNPTEDQTALKNKVWEGNINAFDKDENNPNWIIATACVPGSIGGFTVREMALIDNEGDMIAICKSPETYKPKVGNGAMKDLYLKFIIEVSNVEKVTLVVDPTAIFLTKKDEEKIVASISKLDTKIDTTKTELKSNIETAKTEIDEKIGDTTQLTTTDKTNIVSALNEVKTSVDSIETTAEKTSIKDTDNLFESDNVEGALKELAENYNTLSEKQNNLETEVNGQRTKGITIVNNLIDMI
ncbi:TPA: phage tail protein [Clostridioides difficile]|uniref:phage tail protein n=1 Tax=Clostridioides difficile TaxID=1496 RepID=UPI000D1E343D|nr:phage tail protein [Clostridioides difficile]VFC49532.1 tail fiber protein [Clostridioides difficile]HBF3595770.1 phage tail protein [Clostridioides difficile]HBF6521072.1 phage tail protein [Clostridioides difficile]HBF7276898.1 phage tail protein [Clostridioides difficile]HBG3423719.1 phage tail protein [Clostridioides difficile]